MNEPYGVKRGYAGSIKVSHLTAVSSIARTLEMKLTLSSSKQLTANLIYNDIDRFIFKYLNVNPTDSKIEPN